MSGAMKTLACVLAFAIAGAAAAQDYVPTPTPSTPPVVDAATLADPQLQRGRAVFDAWCAHCHGQGPGHPGTDALAAKYGDALPALIEHRTDLTPELTAFFVRNGISVMAPFRKVEISDTELADLGAYLARPR